MENKQADEKLLDLIRLRLAVAALGERYGWWDTDCCTPAHFGVFKKLFPKSWRLASFSAVSESAKQVHRAIVTARSQHLFRFMSEIERDMRHYLTTEEGEKLFDSVLNERTDPEEVLASLAAPGQKAHPGAVEMGIADKEFILNSVPKMAGLYLAAFRHRMTSFPYFLPKDSE